MQDIPNHLAIVRTLADESSDAAWGERFENRLRPDAYSTYYAACTSLARHVGAEAANRIILMLYTALLPLAFLALVLVYDPTRRWNVVPVFLLIYSDLYLVGLANYLLAMPMLLAGAAVGIGIARSEVTNWLAVLALAVIGVALYFTHPFVLAMLFVVLAVLTLFSRPGPNRMITLGVGLLPGLILVLQRLPTSGIVLGSTYRVGLGFKIRYLLTTPLFALDAHRHWSFYVAGGLGLLFIGLAAHDLLRDRGSSRSASSPPWWRSWLVAVVALFVVVYFAAPFKGASAMWFDLRLALVAWLLLFLALSPQWTRDWLRRGLLIAMSAASLLGVWSLHWEFDREIAPLFDVIERMEPSARVLPIVADASSTAIQPFYTRDKAIPYYSPYAHFGAYYHVEKGGESPFMTFHSTLNWIPLRLRDPFYGHFRIGEPFFPELMLRNLPSTASRFDYILVRGLYTDVVDWVERFGAPVASVGEFAAFAVGVKAPSD